MAMNARQLQCCSANCASGLREDRRHGLIYGPYSDGTREPDGSPHFIGALELAGLDDSCTYCRGPLPRGRAKRILQRLGKSA